MLEMFRRGAQGWVAKIFFGILVLSFAVWGVADVFRGYGEGALARVGKTEISTSEFQTAFQGQVEQLRRRYGPRMTADMARLSQVDQQVLQQLVANAAIENHAKALKLGVSEKAIVDSIKKEPSLQGTDGKFNRLAFESVLRQAGVSERGFIAEQKRLELRNQLTQALLAGTSVPDATIDLLHKFREETRNAQHFTVDPAKVVKLAEPDDAKLKETYEASKKQFVTPESRKLAVLLLSSAEMKKRVTINDDDVKADYEADKERFNIPEKRKLQQIAFPDKAAAEKAIKAVAAGKSFADIAKEAGAKDSDIELGLMTKKELIDQKVATAAFALAKDKISGLVEGQFATVLLKVVEIQPGKQRTLEEVKGEIRDALATKRSNDDVQKLQAQVEEARSSGKTLKEAADALKVPFVEIAGTDKKALGPDGKPVLEGPDGERVVASAFDNKIGVESEAVELSNGGVAWVDVLGVTPEKQRLFEEVKADVKAVWTVTETRKGLVDATAKLVDRIAKGETMEALAKEVGGKVETAAGLRRGAAAGGLPENVGAQAFIIANGSATAADAADGKSRVLLKVTEIKVAAAATKEQSDKIKAEVGRQVQNDLYASYIGALREAQGVTINQAALARALGADRQAQ
jgi:peptidyl-prolyl cis-trans isomerase D